MINESNNLNINTTKIHKIGEFSNVMSDIIKELTTNTGINLEGAPILIGPSNIKHVKDNRPEICANYLDSLPNIISSPDYIGVHPNGKSLELVKELDDTILVAIRLRNQSPFWVKSFYVINDTKLSNYIRSGRTIDLSQLE